MRPNVPYLYLLVILMETETYMAATRIAGRAATAAACNLLVRGIFLAIAVVGLNATIAPVADQKIALATVGE